jgi:hypothetical protein
MLPFRTVAMVSAICGIDLAACMSVQDIGSIFDLLYIKRRRVDLEFCIVVLAGSSINIRYSSRQSVSV